MPKPDQAIRAYRVPTLAAAGKGDGKRRWHVILTAGTMEGEPVSGLSEEEQAAGGITYTPEQLEAMVDAFDGTPVPVGIHHATYMAWKDEDPRWMTPELSKARGWILEVAIEDNQLLALIEWTDEGAKLIDERGFLYFSIELGRKRPSSPITVVGGTLTNEPYWDLPPLTDGRIAASRSHLPIVVYAAPHGALTAGSDPKEADMPSLKELQEQVTALMTERDELKRRITEAAEPPDQNARVTALEKALETERARAERLERLAKAERERRQEAAISEALAAGMRNDETVLATARKRWDLSEDTGESFYAEFVAANTVVRIAPTGHGGSDRSTWRGDSSTPTTPEEAGDVLHERAMAILGKEPTVDYTTAYGRVLADPTNAEIVALYDETSAKGSH